jgi:hypothetical protein
VRRQAIGHAHSYHSAMLVDAGPRARKSAEHQDWPKHISQALFVTTSHHRNTPFDNENAG